MRITLALYVIIISLILWAAGNSMNKKAVDYSKSRTDYYAEVLK